MKKLLGIMPKPIFICSVVAVAIVSAAYVVSQWYYSRWGATLFDSKGDPAAAWTYGAGQLRQFSDDYIGASDPSSRSPEQVKQIEAFESLITDHPLIQYQADSVKILERQFKVTKGEHKTQRAWEIIDRFDSTHDFMLQLTKMYLHDTLPFEKDHPAYEVIGKMVNTYRRFVEETEDPFGAETFTELQQQMEQEERERTSDPRWIRQHNEYKDTLALAEQIQAELDAFKQKNPNLIRQVTNTPWTMGSPETNASSAATPSQPVSSVFEGESDVNVSAGDAMSDDTLSYQESNEPPTEIPPQEQTSFSPEQFENAIKLIDQYGTEEGLRRLKQTDPELARQFEGRDFTSGTTNLESTR